MAARPRPAAKRTGGWSDPAFARVAAVVYAVAGLVFPPNRQPSAEAGMRRAMTSLRIADPDLLATMVGAPGEARDALLAELTVGETYFFREAAQLDLLRTDVLPSLLAARSAVAPLRLWSAGCASGEEPYTLAILLRELGWPHPAEILGTDVSSPRLASARRGRYTRWSLRGVSAQRVERWFHPVGTQFQLDPAIRASVRFAPLNLMSTEYPSMESGTANQDVVLCRNVLIYFDMPSVALIASRLLAALAPDGWLLLGASDPPLAELVPCEVVMTPAGIAYRRDDRDPGPGARLRNASAVRTPTPADASAAIPPAFTPSATNSRRVPDTSSRAAGGLEAATSEPISRGAVDDDRRVVESAAPATTADDADPRTRYMAGDYARAEALSRSFVESDAGDVRAWVILVRALANQGRLREADEQCTRALDHHRGGAELHYLHAMLLSAAGQYRESAKAARRAIYLDPRFVMAHLQMGDALARLDDTERAVLAFENATQLLADMTNHESIEGSDGVSASRLRQVAELRLGDLRGARRGR